FTGAANEPRPPPNCGRGECATSTKTSAGYQSRPSCSYSSRCVASLRTSNHRAPVPCFRAAGLPLHPNGKSADRTRARKPLLFLRRGVCNPLVDRLFFSAAAAAPFGGAVQRTVGSERSEARIEIQC